MGYLLKRKKNTITISQSHSESTHLNLMMSSCMIEEKDSKF